MTGPRPAIATIGNAGVEVRWRGHDVWGLDGILETTLRVCTYSTPTWDAAKWLLSNGLAAIKQAVEGLAALRGTSVFSSADKNFG
jgi:hypothetical protein